MNVLDMYKIAENEKIDILDYKWTNAKARIVELNNSYYIGLDTKKIDSSIEEKEILAEELGHYFCNALYFIDSDKTLKRKCELRALKWAYSVLVPFNKLKEKISEGLNIYELSDYFEVDYKYMSNCINFYCNKYNIIGVKNEK